MITETKTINGLTSKTLTISDFNGNKRSVTDGRGHTTLFDYDEQNRLKSVMHPDGSSKVLAYDAHGNLVTETDETGASTFHEYDALNRRIKTTVDMNRNGLADGRYTSGSLDSGGLPTYNGDLVTDRVYNSLNLPVRITDPCGVVTEHEYDVLGRLTQTTVNSTAGNADQKLITAYSYKEASVNGGKEGGSSVFDVSAFKPVKITDPRGNVTTFRYDALYRPVAETRPDGSVIHKTYNKGGQVTSISDPAAPAWTPVYTTGAEDTPVLAQSGSEPYVTRMSYDVSGQMIRTVFADGNDTEASYTPYGAVWKAKDEAGAVTLSYFDTSGRPIKIVQDKADDEPGTANAETRTEYDAAGNAIKVTDPRNYTTRTVFDTRNRPVAVILPLVTFWNVFTFDTQSPVTLTEYDAVGRVTKVTGPLGATTRTFYDAAGRAVRIFDTRDKVTHTTYDCEGRILTVVNALGQTVTNVYDALGRMIKTTDGNGQTTFFAYDKAGNRILVVDGRATGTSWSGTDACAWAAQWDAAWKSNWAGGIPAPFSPYHTTFCYDSLNRLSLQTFANGDRWSYAYNRIGTVHQKTDPQNRVTTFTYDSRHRLDVTTGPAGSLLESDRDYDPAGRLQNVADRSVQLLPLTSTTQQTDPSSYTYDRLGRVRTETSYGRTHSYQYDLSGNRIRTSLAVQGTVPRLLGNVYDATNRLLVMQEDNRTATTADDRITGYWYDLAGREVNLVRAAAGSQVSDTWNEYDVLGRLLTRKVYKGFESPSNIQAAFTWAYDDIGNVKSQTEIWYTSTGSPSRNRVTVMNYDGANRLVQEAITDSGTATVTTVYTYDGAGNRLTKHVSLGSGTAPAGIEAGHWTFTYNSACQLTRMDKRAAAGGAVTGGASYTYDTNGNRTGKVADGSTAAGLRTFTYGWDAWDRLKETTVPVTATTKKTFRYTYDARMRRIGRAQSIPGTGVSHRAVVYSGGLSVAEYNRSSNTELTSSSAPAVQYVRGQDMGGGVGGLVYSLRGTTVKYNVSNGRGDIVAQVNGSGVLSWTGSYEAYGKVTKETGTNVDTQRGNSKEEEEEAGLLNEGFRYRDIETGVWLSRDPAGFVDGPNLYAYVKQNPWTGFDPDGLKGEYAHATMTALNDGMEFVADVVCAVGKGIGAVFAGTNRRSQIQYQLNINPQASEKQIQESANRQIAVNQSLEALAAVPHKPGRIPLSEPPTATGRGTLERGQASTEMMPTPYQQAQGSSKRSQYMGKTPGKTSSTGQIVIERMAQEGKIRSIEGKVEVKQNNGTWVPIEKTDMSHLKDAVKEWNDGLYKTGKKSPEVRDFMKNPDNYELESSSSNRARGGATKDRYREPETSEPVK